MADNVIPFPGTDPDNIDHPGPNTLSLDELAEQFIEQFGSVEAALAQLGMFGGFAGPAGSHAPGGSSRFGANPFGFMPARPKPQLLKKRKAKATFVVRIDLDNAKPPIWRRLRLASDMNLEHLHDILQIAMGWTNSHLHQFKMGPASKDYQMTPFLTAYDIDVEGETAGIPERDVRLDQVLAEPGHRLFYEYDFGDGWEHTIKLESVERFSDGDPEAHCVTGRRACPPEDVGGLPGYEHAVAGLRGEPTDGPEWTRHLLDWLPPDWDPEHFDADDVNDQLRQGPPDLARWHPRLGRLLTMGGAQFSPIASLVAQATSRRVDLTELSDDELDAATRPFRHLVAVVGDGIKLTQAGYLPPALVRQLIVELDINGYARRATREDQCYPLLDLREATTSLGLLRKQHGKLLPTASAKRLVGDPRKLFTHIRDRLPLGRRDSQQDAGVLALLYAAQGKDFYTHSEEAGAVLGSLGWSSYESMGTIAWHESTATRDVLDHLAGGAEGDAKARVARALLAR